jgi:hypothetical protein
MLPAVAPGRSRAFLTATLPRSEKIEDEHMPRRLAGLLPLAAALLLSGCAAEKPAGPPALVGAWRSQVQFDSGPFAAVKDLEFMYVFNAGGTLTESSNYDAAPPVPPAYGAWRAVGANEFEAKYEFYTTAPAPPADFTRGAGWLPSGRGVLTERISLAADSQTFRSTVHFEAFGTRGDSVVARGDAHGRGVRIRP